MRLVKFREGSACTIWALDLGTEPNSEDCPAKAFFDGLSEASAKSLMNILQLHAEVGPIKNEQKSRLLDDVRSRPYIDRAESADVDQ